MTLHSRTDKYRLIQTDRGWDIYRTGGGYIVDSYCTMFFPDETLRIWSTLVAE
jgi:hypothetical protein